MSLLSSRNFLRLTKPSPPFVCLLCAARRSPHPQIRLLSASVSVQRNKAAPAKKEGDGHAPQNHETNAVSQQQKRQAKGQDARAAEDGSLKEALLQSTREPTAAQRSGRRKTRAARAKKPSAKQDAAQEARPKTLKEALSASRPSASKRKPKDGGFSQSPTVHQQKLPIEELSADKLHFDPVEHKIPRVPRLSYGLDRVLFNPGVYRLQDPRSRVYNFDPYLEKIMPVTEFDFDALTEYKTSSRDQDLLDMTRRLDTKFTGSTSSMSSVLQQFHFLLSDYRPLNHNMLSRGFPNPSPRFSKITTGPSAIFLRWKDGIHAVDADKTFDSPNIMSWLGHSLEKLLTTSREDFETFRRSSTGVAPGEDQSGKCFHYSKIGNFLLRSQLDAYDDRLPGTGIFDLKTRAVVSIRMDHEEYEVGSGYQIRYDQGQWESYEREFFDMTRATLLKYSLQVRMGRMDGIFVAYHNIERIFGFQYLSLPDMDNVLHGQTDTCLGDQEFKLSVGLLDEIFQRATAKFPNTTIRLHFETQQSAPTYMRIFAEPVTEEQADALQDARSEERREFERTVIGLHAKPDDPDVQAAWQNIQSRVDEELVNEEKHKHQKPVSATAGDWPIEEQPEGDEDVESEEGPLMGWTLTIRNRVNGTYVQRPEGFTPEDEWSIEYYLKEMDAKTRWKQYRALQKRREKLIGQTKEEQSASLKSYRNMIHNYSRAGRRWREEQDEIDAKIGQKVYRPIGPGAEEVV